MKIVSGDVVINTDHFFLKTQDAIQNDINILCILRYYCFYCKL